VARRDPDRGSLRLAPVTDRTDLIDAREAAELAQVSPAALRSTAVKLRAQGTELLAPRELWRNGREASYSRAAVLAWRESTPQRARR
jgi:hypothetical protein